MRKSAGCKTILIETGHGGRDGIFNTKPDFKATDLYVAVTKIILKSLYQIFY